jgi:hypothetical protein
VPPDLLRQVVKMLVEVVLPRSEVEGELRWRMSRGRDVIRKKEGKGESQRRLRQRGLGSGELFVKTRDSRREESRCGRE